MPIPTTLSVAELHARLAFWRIKGVGPKLMADCLQRFSSIQAVFEQKKELPATLAFLLEQADWRGAESDLQWLALPEHFLLQHNDLHFPACLAAIPAAPPFIFVRGNVACLEKMQLAMVGSRNPTYYGIQAAQYFASALTQAGFVLTSGLALGIDAAVHEATLAAQGQTIAVLGVGLDSVYPKRHQKLAERIIAADGALISEFGVGTAPLPEHFPRRNRLISGLSVGVIVVEATIKSGSLITARFALEQGREVFAVPGSIFQAQARGCHALIKQGAKCVEEVGDVLSELHDCPLSVQQVAEKKVPLTENAHESSEAEKQLLKKLSAVPQSFEQLLAQLPWEVGLLHATLAALIVKGSAEKTWFGYVRCLA